MTGFQDRVAVITGGTGVLGRAVTRLFVAEGARVVVPCRSAEDARALREEQGDRAGVLLAERVDVTTGAELTRFVDGVVDKLERLDYLVNVIGGFAGGRPLYETDEATWDHMMELNLRSAARSSLRRTSPPMPSRKPVW
jgi:3-oxoacyl-[acyl-carrier protein] reductase